MHLVFSNTLEKEREENRVTVAQVSIVEEQGTYRMIWREDKEQGAGQEIWYEGTSWEEMMAIFRYRILEKQVDGYVPLVKSMPGTERRNNTIAGASQMLLYYAEKHRNEPLFAELRQWRRTKASGEGKPPFLIAGNRLLTLISAFVPRNNEELRQIPGFGEHKLALFGADILKITAKHKQTTAFPLDWVAKTIDMHDFQRWVYKQMEQKYKAEAEKLAVKKKFLQGVQNGLNLDDLSAELPLSRREITELAERLEAEGYDLHPFIERECGKFSDQDVEKVMRLFSEHGDQYLKPVLENWYTPEQLDKANLEDCYIQLRILRMRYRSQVKQSARRTG
ncbi:MAG TPA: HRDC domain-containing protein [Bacilli bacterium]